MPDLAVRTFPDIILRKKAKKVDKIGDWEAKLFSKMAETMYLNKGVGLAAPQVGIDRQLAVIDAGDGLIRMANPVIVKREGSEVQEEGCLSVPKTYVKVSRAKRIVVSYLNESGDAIRLKAEGLLARVIQHEIDHLSGTLIIDYLNPIKRLFLRRGSLSMTKNRLDKS